MQLLTQFAAEEAETGIAALGIDPVAILLQAGTFLILFVIIRKYALDKINKTLRDRRETIDESLDNAEKIEKRLERVTHETEDMLTTARKEADSIITKATIEAADIVNQAQDKASKRADEILAEGTAQLTKQTEAARKELKNEVLSLVAEATEALIDEKMDQSKDQKLIERFLKR